MPTPAPTSPRLRAPNSPRSPQRSPPKSNGALAILCDLASERELHSDGRPLPVPVTLERERSGVRLGHDSRDVEADAHTGKGARASRAADEGVTELRDLVGRDSDPLVGDRDLGTPVVRRKRDAHLAAGRRVFHRVPNEVHKEL